ncbi:cortex morphogenetic protein CmpA [Tumebacillus avium]|uniref:Cortex morphogenetic protein CmpA n=1 Tax=Tumebacillus avium TaxID=1903704 RepID=A0A1Y0IMK8_9BACL|nr:cortex morphogenetic protein CmpA [Tumebacillus avium]ARU60593.1 cortex morphogenetic protein CmpA [Tumebacillus avium]
MPSWLRNQLSRAFREKDKRSIVMLNRVFYKYQNTLRQEDAAEEAE